MPDLVDDVIVEEPPLLDESALDRVFVEGATDWRFNDYERALAHAVRVGTKAQPYRVHREGAYWYSSRAARSQPIPTGPWPRKRRAR